MEQAISFLKLFTGQGSDGISQTNVRDYESPPTISILANRIVVVATAFAACLVLVSFTSDVAIHLNGAEHAIFSKLSKAFSVDRESNVSAFFSALLLIAASALLAGISMLSRAQTSRDHRYWLALAAGFLFMAFDEIAEVHERLIEPIRNMLGGGDLGVLYYAWVIPGVAVVMLCGGIFFRFWWNLPPRVRFLIFIAAGLYLGGAVGVELVGGKHAEMFGTANLKYVCLTTIEETLEITGSILFIKALLDHLSETSSGRLMLRLTTGRT